MEKYRNIALYFTMAAALLAGAVWAFTEIADNASSASDTIETVLIVAIVVGGIVMGLLYLARLSSKKRRELYFDEPPLAKIAGWPQAPNAAPSSPVRLIEAGGSPVTRLKARRNAA